MNFDMNLTWSQATGMVRANWQTLSLLAGVFFLLPNLVLIIAMPDVMTLLIAPGGDPEQMMAQLSAQVGSLAVVFLVAALFSMVGYAAMVELLGPRRPTVGEALRASTSALPTLFGCLLVGFVGYMVFALVIGLVLGLVGALLGAVLGEGGAAAFAVIGVFAMIIALIMVALRFILVMPAVMLEGVRNPLAAFGRSWRLTAPARSRIVLFFVLLFIAYMVLSLLLFSIVGLSGSVFVIGLVSGVAGAAVGMLLSGILVSMHQQLSGDVAAAADVFE